LQVRLLASDKDASLRSQVHDSTWRACSVHNKKARL